jgi:hypothetical protein
VSFTNHAPELSWDSLVRPCARTGPWIAGGRGRGLGLGGGTPIYTPEERRKKAACALMGFPREIHGRAVAIGATGMTHGGKLLQLQLQAPAP